jgi:cell wall-associated NlpC family hydrolase
LKASSRISSSRSKLRAEPPRNGPSSSSTAERFALTGPSLALDERVHAYRRDIADIALAGQLFAPHYARPLIRSCGVRATFVRPRPSAEADPSSELLPGEEMSVLEFSGGWAWGYSRHDHYVGYVEAIELVDAPPPTHIVTAREATILPEPDAKVPALATLPMGSRLTGEVCDGFVRTEIGFVSPNDVRELGATEKDPVTVAERLIGAPYLMGGRTPSGIDCSGLVQLSLALCGIPAPRDSDQQRVLGTPLEEEAELRRGDILFFEGHVGFMADAERLIHATGHHGSVVLEPLAEVAARTAVQDRRRLP